MFNDYFDFADTLCLGNDSDDDDGTVLAQAPPLNLCGHFGVRAQLEPLFLNAAAEFRQRRNHPVTAVVALAMDFYTNHGFSLTGDLLKQSNRAYALAMGIENPPTFKCPPQNLSRAVKNLVDLRITKHPLSAKLVAGTELRGNFTCQNLEQAAIGIYLSSTNRTIGTFHHANNSYQSKCGARGQFGNRAKAQVAEFCKANRIDTSDASKVVLVCSLYGDGTSTNFYSIHPLSIRLENFDVDAMNHSKPSSMVIATVPTRAELEHFRDGKVIPMFQLPETVNVNQVLKQFLRDSFRILLNLFKQTEGGIDVIVPGRGKVTFYLLLGHLEMDLEERRTLFDLVCSRCWNCDQCYLFRGACETTEAVAECEDVDEGLESDTEGKPSNQTSNTSGYDQTLAMACKESGLSADKLMVRSWATDKALVDLFRSNNGDPVYSPKRKQSPLKLFGVKPDCDYVFYLPSGAPRLFLLHNNATLLLQPDALHVLGGVTKRFFLVSSSFYPKETLRVSSMLGNKNLGIANGIAFYQLEKQLENLFPFAVALFCSSAKPTVPLNVSQAVQSLLFNFLLYVCCAKDDFIATCRQLLSKSIAAMKAALLVIEPVYAEITGGKSVSTAKVHQMIYHSESCMEEAGSLKSCSTMHGENLHPEIRKQAVSGSGRIDVRSGDAIVFTTISRIQHDSAVALPDHYMDGEIFGDVDSKVVHSEKLLAGHEHIAVSKVIKHIGEIMSVIDDALREQLAVFTEANVRLNLVNNNFGSFGNSFTGCVVSAHNGAMRKGEESFRLGGHVWSYWNGKEENLGNCVQSPPCRAHSTTNQLFPSLSRTVVTSSFGFPLLLLKTQKEKWIVWMLELTSKVSDWSFGDACQQFELHVERKWIPLERVRDFHKFCSLKRRVFVYNASCKTHGHHC